MAAKFRRALLASVAAEMNEVMGLTPPIQEDMADDDTLLTTICYEATGRGILKDAIRADDFDSDDSGKKTFTAPVAKFFADADVWDAEAQAPIMPAAAKAAAAKKSAEPELPLAVEEQAEHDEMEAGETAGEELEPVAKTKAVAKKAAAKTTKPAKAVVAEKEAVVKTTKAAVAKKRATKSVIATKKVTAKKAVCEAVLSCFGHREGSNGYKMDEAINAGKSLAAIAKAADVDEKRVRGHAQHLKAEHSVHVTFDEVGKVGVKKIKK